MGHSVKGTFLDDFQGFRDFNRDPRTVSKLDIVDLAQQGSFFRRNIVRGKIVQGDGACVETAQIAIAHIEILDHIAYFQSDHIFDNINDFFFTLDVFGEFFFAHISVLLNAFEKRVVPVRSKNNGNS
jgi:hypothetical protein